MAQKTEESEDLRVRRTRKLIQQAFLELTVEQGFAALTVRDITKRAMINRSTFYRHYLDKYDLLEQYMQELYELTGSSEERAVTAERPGRPSATFSVGLVNLLQHIQEFGDFYRVMLGAKGDPLFAQRFRQNTEKRFRSLFAQLGGQPEPNGPPVDLRISCIAYAGVGAIVWWLEQEQPCPPEQLAIWLGPFSSALAGRALKPNR